MERGGGLALDFDLVDDLIRVVLDLDELPDIAGQLLERNVGLLLFALLDLDDNVCAHGERLAIHSDRAIGYIYSLQRARELAGAAPGAVLDFNLVDNTVAQLKLDLAPDIARQLAERNVPLVLHLDDHIGTY